MKWGYGAHRRASSLICLVAGRAAQGFKNGCLGFKTDVTVSSDILG
jgi:hypothetical protein